jgi:hypothetical protein
LLLAATVVVLISVAVALVLLSHESSSAWCGQGPQEQFIYLDVHINCVIHRNPTTTMARLETVDGSIQYGARLSAKRVGSSVRVDRRRSGGFVPAGTYTNDEIRKSQ